MTTELVTYLKLNIALKKEQLENLVDKFEKRQLKADQYLIKKGHIETNYYFIESGFLRSYYINNKKEHTVWIEAPGELVCEIKSLRFQQPTEYNIQAMEPVTYYVIEAKLLDSMVDQNAELQRFLIRLWETRFIIALDGLRAFQTKNAKERYEYLIKNFPNFQKLPLHQLANILGITQSSLSRIRRLR